MIIALEGVDRSGKSTLFEALRPHFPDAKFVPSIRVPKELYPVMSWVEERQAALWECLYDRQQVYITDRSVFTSAPVYAKLLNRPLLVSTPPWDIKVVWVYAPFEVLVERYKKLGNDDYLDESKLHEALNVYEEVVSQFHYFVYDGRTQSVQDVVTLLRRWME